MCEDGERSIKTVSLHERTQQSGRRGKKRIKKNLNRSSGIVRRKKGENKDFDVS